MSQSSPLVSIITPAYQADRFLGETLDHLACQTYKNWEIIIVEDASCGDTEAIVQQFSAQNPQQRVVYRRHETNQGPSASRNTALTEAHGEYIALLDADDLWLPDHLQVCVQALQQQTMDLTYSTPVLFDDETGYLLGIWGANQDERENLPSSLFRRNFITPSTVVMRREVFDKVGQFDTTPAIQGCEDLDFWLRCVQRNISFACLPGCHCLYRKGHPQAATTHMYRLGLRHALVLEKHLGMAGVPQGEQHCHLSNVYKDAARRNFRRNPFKSAAILYKAWQAYPRRIDTLARAFLALSYGVGRSILVALHLIKLPPVEGSDG